MKLHHHLIISPFHQVLDFILILRVTRIFKVFHAIPRFRTVLNTLVDILPSLLTYGSILFVVYYFFAIIGMELFQVCKLPIILLL